MHFLDLFIGPPESQLTSITTKTSTEVGQYAFDSPLWGPLFSLFADKYGKG